MKWFRHYTNANQDEGLRKLANSMGMEGVGIWWTLLEIIAAKMDETERCHATYSVSDWCSFLKVKQKKLSLFLVLTEFELGIKSVRSDNELRIECRNLLKYRDEYSRKSGQTTDKNPPQSQSQSQKQNQTTSPPTPPVAQTGAERPDRAGGGSVVLGGAEGAEGAVSFILNGSKPPEGVTPLDILQGHVSNGATVVLPRLSPEQKAQMLAESKAETARVVAESRAKLAAERELENKHLDEKLQRDAVTWADEFAELIPNCTDQDKADIFTQIKRLSTHEWLPNMLQDIKRGIESGEVRSPKGVIIHRLKKQT